MPSSPASATTSGTPCPKCGNVDEYMGFDTSDINLITWRRVCGRCSHIWEEFCMESLDPVGYAELMKSLSDELNSRIEEILETLENE